MVISMRHPAWQHTCRFLTLLAAITAAIPAAHAVPQENPLGDPDQSDQDHSNVCSNLGRYIFVGGTAGFNALRDGNQFKELLKSGHVGLYEHANAVDAAENPPSILKAIEQVFSGTGPGEAELGQVGWNYFTLPPSYDYYQEQFIQHGLSPSEANVNTLSDAAAPGQLKEDKELWKEYADAARTAGIESVAPVVGPNDPDEPKLGDNVFATNPFYALERYEALYGKAIAFDVPPNFFPVGADRATKSLSCRQFNGETPAACEPQCCFLLIPGPRILTANPRLSASSPATLSVVTRGNLCAVCCRSMPFPQNGQ